jgi:hypothetical protein
VEDYPVTRASYPTFWPAKWPKEFAGCYSINDAITPRAIETMLLAWRTYGEQRYLKSALKGGDLLLLAQMPPPQPAWAQQYDPNMHPVWDRAFEPPAISGRESQTVLETLLLLRRATGQEKYVEPVPRALEYLRRSMLSDGRLATNYAFIVDSRLDAIEAEYRHIRRDGTVEACGGQGTAQALPSTSLETRVAAVIKSIDARGAWVEKGRLRHHKVQPESGIIDSRTFIDNVEVLCAFLQVTHER